MELIKPVNVFVLHDQSRLFYKKMSFVMFIMKEQESVEGVGVDISENFCESIWHRLNIIERKFDEVNENMLLSDDYEMVTTPE